MKLNSGELLLNELAELGIAAVDPEGDSSLHDLGWQRAMFGSDAPLNVPVRPLVELEHPLNLLGGLHRIHGDPVGVFHE